ncbi:MAG: 23S rRNA (uracil(1939)-C(5))-methyltransferase RlmD [Hydrogenophilus thermoluteolus]|uniref:23S rRNA (uracil(1939)-C(5))-methyltransferase RlmD n=1 Tax=Hydrogenophilus thermoluteolus TaxID=297 RepID=UPI00392C5DE7
MGKARSSATAPVERAAVASLDLEGRGVAHVDGKAVFISGALPGEVVRFVRTRERASYAQGELVAVERASCWRVTPRCPHFGVCGGCAMQHFDASAQVAAKQRVLEDTLWHIARVRPAQVLPPLYGPYWGYRHRARIGARLVPKKGGVLVGFRERNSSHIADMRSCHVLPQRVSVLLPELRRLIGGLSCPDRIPQIEFAAGDDGTIVLVFRHLVPLTAQDEAMLAAFGRTHEVAVWVQPGGPQTMAPLTAADDRTLAYRHPEFDVTLTFLPSDFTQVNPQINRALVRRAVQWLAPQAGERVADWFSGLGNFTLPIARSGATVVGVEGSETMTQRAAALADAHGLGGNTAFYSANLFEMTEAALAGFGRFDKWLLDPPRDGAAALVKAITPEVAPTRIVYVSCHPGTLARDTAILVHEKGYRLVAAGIANMFPHTGHVESMAVFERA